MQWSLFPCETLSVACGIQESEASADSSASGCAEPPGVPEAPGSSPLRAPSPSWAPASCPSSALNSVGADARPSTSSSPSECTAVQCVHGTDLPGRVLVDAEEGVTVWWPSPSWVPCWASTCCPVICPRPWLLTDVRARTLESPGNQHLCYWRVLASGKCWSVGDRVSRHPSSLAGWPWAPSVHRPGCGPLQCWSWVS